MRGRVKPKSGTAAAWTAANTVLMEGEWGYETDTEKIKKGDGSTPWNSLLYFTGSSDTTPPNTPDAFIVIEPGLASGSIHLEWAAGTDPAEGVGGSSTQVWQIVVGDRLTPIPEANNIMSCPVPVNMAVSKILAYVTQPSSTGGLAFGIKVAGASVLSSPLAIAEDAQNGSTTSLSDSGWTEAQEVQIDCSDNGDGAASGLIITVIFALAS